MKKRLFLSFFLLLSWCLTIEAASFPKVSSGKEVTWYFIKFANSGNVIAAQSFGQKALCASMTGQKSQLWKVEGTETDGYTFTNQLGYRLYVNKAAKEGKLFAGTEANNSTFVISRSSHSSYPEAFEISPKNATSVALNQWGGTGVGHEIGLWSKPDENNPVVFEETSALDAYKKLPRLIPYPKNITIKENATLAVSQLTAITYVSEETKKYATDFAAQLQKTAGVSLAVEATANPAKAAAINMMTDATLGDEAYRLVIEAGKVTITAKTKAGFFYGLQTIKQLLPNAFFGKAKNTTAQWVLPQLEITDEPKFGHRGYMLDVARHFFSKQEVLRILDILSFYKMNRFHWHLTDDQGWRVEIPEYPLLTKVGARRSGSFSNAGTNPRFFDDTEYGRGMYYTLDDLKEIVAYASERNIEILPEIDLPGHMVAAVASYPIFSCNPDKEYSVRVNGGISRDVLNIGKDTTIHFLKCILGHVAEIFPHPYIHLGGDECPTEQWENDPHCKARVAQHNLAGVNELQSWLVEELGMWLKEKYNKDIVVWDELLAHWKSSNKVKPLIMAWNGAHLSARAADKGFKSIFVPYQSLYFDMMQVPLSEVLVNEGYQGGWSDDMVNDIPKVYHVDPLVALSNRPDFCLGVQGNMWTETCNDSLQLEYQLLPRLQALSEMAWLPKEQKNWTSFFVRLQGHDEILDSLQYNYAKHYILPAEKTETEALIDEAQNLLSQTRAGEVGYPSVAAANALQDAVAKAKAGTSQTEELNKAVRIFKEEEITPLTDGEIYTIESAATYYKKRYAGSTIYDNNGVLRFHYTPQQEGEELWKAVKVSNGWQFENVMTGRKMSGTSYNASVKTNAKYPATYRIDKATVAVRGHDYVPGAVIISHVTGYVETATGSVKRLFGYPSGEVYHFDDPQLCHPGTWRIVRVADYAVQLRGIVRKAQYIVEDYVAGVVGQPTTESLNYLKNEIVEAGKVALQTAVSKEVYDEYLNRYKKYLTLPRITPAEVLDEDRFYRIQNVYFSDYYVAVDPTNKNLVPSSAKKSDAQLWQIKKNADGSLRLISKAHHLSAMVTGSRDGATVKLTSDYNWRLQVHKTAEGQTGINILDTTGKYSWYTNPGPFKTIVLKPYGYGAAIWKFVPQEETVSGINVIHQKGKGVYEYDLQGRKANENATGVLITSDGEKMIR